jgi:hypothetical protein
MSGEREHGVLQVRVLLLYWPWYGVRGRDVAGMGVTQHRGREVGVRQPLGAVRRVLWLLEADDGAGVRDGSRGHQDMHIRVEECT